MNTAKTIAAPMHVTAANAVGCMVLGSTYWHLGAAALAKAYENDRDSLRGRVICELQSLRRIDPKTGRETYAYPADQFKTSEKGATKGETKPVRNSAAEQQCKRIINAVKALWGDKPSDRAEPKAVRVPRAVSATMAQIATEVEYRVALAALKRAYGK